MNSRSPSLSPVHQAALSFPSNPALIWHKNGVKQELSYTSLSQRVIALSEQLTNQGLIFGDRLACIGTNSIALITLYWACIDTGIIFCPLSPRFPIEQLAALTKQHRFNYIWTSDDYSPHFSRPSSPSKKSPIALFSDKGFSTSKLELDFTMTSFNQPSNVTTSIPVNIILTSGSSGQPKAAVHSLHNHIASAEGASALIPLQANDGWLLSLPLFHIGGLAIVNRCALAGAAIIVQNKKMSLSTQLSQNPITHLSLVSTQLIRLLNTESEGANLSHLKKIKSLLLGGGPISIDLIDKLNELAITHFTSYGMTEMSSQITTGIGSSNGHSGQAISGREIKIIDKQIYVRGETLFLGYLSWDKHHPQLNLPLDKEGWFLTKDRGYWDKEGNLHILGRSDNMFICGGENIQPEEIETALKQHPDIEDAIVFPQIDHQFNYLPAAIIKFLKTNNKIINKVTKSEAFQHFLDERIAHFKRPRVYYLWPHIELINLKASRKQVIAAALKTGVTGEAK